MALCSFYVQLLHKNYLDQMCIRERINLVVSLYKKKPKELEELTGVDRMAWANLKRERIRANEEHISGACKIWPQYAYWITTGKTLPEAGQTSPEEEEMRLTLGQEGRAAS